MATPGGVPLSRTMFLPAAARRSRGHAPLDRERVFGTEQIIVSKTDLEGVITYANAVFAEVSGWHAPELVGRPHSIVRHPTYPGGMFRIMWQTLEAGREVVAYVKNLAKDGSYYWVLAHLVPTWDRAGSLVGYHSSHRVPERAAVEEFAPLYEEMVRIEAGISDRHEGAAASAQLVADRLRARGQTYDHFVWDVINRTGQEV